MLRPWDDLRQSLAPSFADDNSSAGSAGEDGEDGEAWSPLSNDRAVWPTAMPEALNNFPYDQGLPPKCCNPTRRKSGLPRMNCSIAGRQRP